MILAGAVKGGYKTCHSLEKGYGVPRDNKGCHVSQGAPTNRETAPTFFYDSMFH